ncbi:6-pyruvoyl-tetrahydropterin synthase-related protein [Methanopyrus kandleri]
MLLFLGLTAVASLAFLQSPFSAGDSRAHVVKIWFVSELFKRGHWSYWCPVWYCGFPFLLYYPPLFYLVGGALNLPLGDPVQTLRILGLVAVYVLVVGIFFACRQLGFTAFEAALSTLLFLTSPSILWEINRGGIFPMMMSLGFGLLALGLLERMLSRGFVPKSALGIVALATLSLFTHPIGGMTCQGALILRVLLGVVPEESLRPNQWFRALTDRQNLPLLLLAVFPPLLAAPQYLPMLLYRGYISPLVTPAPQTPLDCIVTLLSCPMWSPLPFFILLSMLGVYYALRRSGPGVRLYGALTCLIFCASVFLLLAFWSIYKVAPGGQLITHRLPGVLFPLFGTLILGCVIRHRPKVFATLAIPQLLLFAVYVWSYTQPVDLDSVREGHIPSPVVHLWKAMDLLPRCVSAGITSPQSLLWTLVAAGGFFTLDTKPTEDAKCALHYLRHHGGPYDRVTFDPFTHVSLYRCDSAFVPIESGHYSLLGWFNQGDPAFYSLAWYVEWQHSWVFYPNAVLTVFHLANVRYVISGSPKWIASLERLPEFHRLTDFGRYTVFSTSVSPGPAELVPRPILVIDDILRRPNPYYTMVLNVIPDKGTRRIFVEGSPEDVARFHQIIVRTDRPDTLDEVLRKMKSGRVLVIVPANDYTTARYLAERFGLHVRPVIVCPWEPLPSMKVCNRLIDAYRFVGITVPGATPEERTWFLFNGRPWVDVKLGKVKVRVCGVDFVDLAGTLHQTLYYGAGAYPLPPKWERTLLNEILRGFDSGKPRPVKFKAVEPDDVRVRGKGYILVKIGYHPAWHADAPTYRGSGGLIIVRSTGVTRLRFGFTWWERMLWWGAFAIGLMGSAWLYLRGRDGGR